jgi:hypothetical protein
MSCTLWTPEMEQLVRRMVADTTSYSWMYGIMATNAQAWLRYVTLYTGIIGAVAGTSGLVGVVAESNIPQWISIIVFILNFTCAATMVALNVWDLAEVAMTARAAQCKFATLKNELELQLALTRNQRTDPRILVLGITEQIRTIQLSSPIIYAGIQRRGVIVEPTTTMQQLESSLVVEVEPVVSPEHTQIQIITTALQDLDNRLI